MTPNAPPPKVFISYSWTSKNWVIAFATRLTGNGIHVVLDEWDVAGGQDLNAFMEKMVLDPSIDKVLVICDHAYATKANQKTGGVGKESQIMSKEIYEKVDQTKFIPIVREAEEDGKPSKPVYLQSRLHFDFSSEERYEANYESLVRNIFGKPKHIRPPLGAPPNFVTEEQPIIVNTKTGKALQQLRSAISQSNPNLKNILKDYLEQFQTAILEFYISEPVSDEAPYVTALNSFSNMKPYRDEFVLMVNHLCKSTLNTKIYVPEFVEFLQILSSYADYIAPEVRSSNELWNDNLKLFLHELFLYFISVLIKHKQYQMIFDLTNTTYCIERRQGFIVKKFPVFRNYAKSPDLRSEQLGQRHSMPTGNLFKERATLTDIPFADLMQTDFVLLLSSLMVIDNEMRLWYPVTLIYYVHGPAFRIFKQAIAKRYFAEIKDMFGVNTKEQLIGKLQAGMQRFESNTPGGRSIIQNGNMRIGDFDSISIMELANIDQLDLI